MRPAWLLVLLAAPAVAVAQVPPQPGDGQITFADVLNDDLDGFINAAECNGDGTVDLSWNVALVEGATDPGSGIAVTYQLYAASKATPTDRTAGCFKENGEDGDDSLFAGGIATLDSEFWDQVFDQEFATSVIAEKAGKDCDETTTETIFLCVEALDNGTLLGIGRGQLTLDRRAPARPDAPTVTTGHEALNVEWNDVDDTSPIATYYVVEATPVSTTTVPTVSSGPVSTNEHRLIGLTNYVQYDVRVFSFSSADNRSEQGSDPTPGEPKVVLDFFEAYRQVGQEQGGCASGAAGLLALLGVASYLAFRRRS